MRLFALVFVSLVLAAPVSAQTRSEDVGTANDKAVTYLNRGIADEHEGRHDEAISDLTQAIVLRPDFADAYESRGVAYDQKGLYDLAIADYTRAIALKADTAETYFNRGAAYEHRRSFRKAVADYRASLALDPTLQPSKDGLKRLGAAR